MKLEYVKAASYYKSKIFECPYNAACRCREKLCGNCGWNPKVALKRREEIMERVSNGKCL